ncbi:MAG: DJ-1/PfpI family protein [Cyanobacteria bacterium P01_G01_bin.54]
MSNRQEQREWNIFFLLFDYVEVLDFSGSFDVFSMANIPLETEGESSYDQGQFFKLYTVSESGETVTALHGLKIEPDYSFATCPNDSIDVLIIPGASTLIIQQLIKEHPTIVDWVTQRLPQVPIVASVCVGALILAKAGGFDSARQCTTHHGAIKDLKVILAERETDVTVIPGARYVDNPEMQNPRILSSGGVSAGIDQAFYLLREILGDEALASITATIMEYNETRNWAYPQQ